MKFLFSVPQVKGGEGIDIFRMGISLCCRDHVKSLEVGTLFAFVEISTRFFFPCAYAENTCCVQILRVRL